VFVQTSGTWVQQAELTASDGAAFDEFGSSVAVSGSTIVVGAGWRTVGSNNSQGRRTCSSKAMEPGASRRS